MTCEYLNCKFKTKGKNEFCGRHQNLGKKLKNPELYCTAKKCTDFDFKVIFYMRWIFHSWAIVSIES